MLATVLARSRWLALVLAVTALGCARSFDALAQRDGGRDAARTEDEPDAGVLGELELTEDQAACIGVDRAPCAACHVREDRVYLRPFGVPPPPPGSTPLREPSECGVVVP
ncbi:hypothetical protein [Sandaracinus amylolyticus]|uniref:hypothetical protein n=1 Tax=Sandaracinus amylolyticus TaxID=927083 RepID=UPI001F2297AD|nr:hypothetical protein [Sandaracinus amylolyticus]UJR87145.1 Hypothetical protein I5071_92460 [Sandaracinus amylolyticus]